MPLKFENTVAAFQRKGLFGKEFSAKTQRHKVRLVDIVAACIENWR